VKARNHLIRTVAGRINDQWCVRENKLYPPELCGELEEILADSRYAAAGD